MTLEQAKANGLDIAHQQWLGHPITQLLLKSLQTHYDKQAWDAIGNSATLNVDDAAIRRGCVSARNTMVVIEAIKSFDVFIKMGMTQEDIVSSMSEKKQSKAQQPSHIQEFNEKQ